MLYKSFRECLLKLESCSTCNTIGEKTQAQINSINVISVFCTKHTRELVWRKQKKGKGKIKEKMKEKVSKQSPSNQPRTGVKCMKTRELITAALHNR